MPSASHNRQVIVLLILSILAFDNGCGRNSTKKTPAINSVSGLLEFLPNLKSLGVQACSFTAESHSDETAFSLPSPSNTRQEIKGYVSISPDGKSKLMSNFNWTDTSKASIPKSLQALVPSGSTSTSDALNATFESNGTFNEGMIVLSAGSDKNVLYFIAVDREHSLE